MRPTFGFDNFTHLSNEVSLKLSPWSTPLPPNNLGGRHFLTFGAPFGIHDCRQYPALLLKRLAAITHLRGTSHDASTFSASVNELSLVKSATILNGSAARYKRNISACSITKIVKSEAFPFYISSPPVFFFSLRGYLQLQPGGSYVMCVL